jgi:hypothetical protein
VTVVQKIDLNQVCGAEENSTSFQEIFAITDPVLVCGRHHFDRANQPSFGDITDSNATMVFKDTHIRPRFNRIDPHIVVWRVPQYTLVH